MAKRLALVFGIILLSLSAFAQTYTITGRIIDANDNSTLIGVTAVLTKISDTTNKTGTVTDANGNFEIDGVSQGKYLLLLDYLGYKPVNKTVIVADKNIPLGAITMK